MNWQDLSVLALVLASFVGLFALRRRRLNFSVITLIALGVGIPIGIAGQGHASYIEPIGKIYISLLLACVAPLIVVSIIGAIVSLGTIDKLRTIGLRSVGWLLLSNFLAVILALALALVLGTGKGVNETLGGEELSVLQNSVQSFTDVVVGFFPGNVFQDLSANHIIPLIIVSVTIAIAYLSIAGRDAESVRPFKDIVLATKRIIFKAVTYVIKLTPYAIVALTATVVANSADLGTKFWSLLGLLGIAWGACFAHAYLFNGVLLRSFARVSPVSFFRKIAPAQITAFTTQSSVGTLPVTTDVLTKRVGVSSQVAHFVAPLGTTIGMPGCAGIWPMLIAVWGINAYGIDYTVRDYVILALLGTIVSVGVAGVPGTATVAAATVLAAAGLPLEFIAVTLPISVIADMARTLNNVTAAATSATIVARQTGLLDDDIFAGTKEYQEEDVSDAVAVEDAIPTTYRRKPVNRAARSLRSRV